MMPEEYKKYCPKLFSKGKRGLIYVFVKKNKKYAIKIKNPKSKAYNRIMNEGKFLKLLNKYQIGPQIIDFSESFVCYEFIEGIELKECINKKIHKDIIRSILKQCEIMDNLKINKEEMHKPLKNIIIKKNKAFLIDFERCHYTLRPKNVNQFKEFLRRIEWDSYNPSNIKQKNE